MQRTKPTSGVKGVTWRYHKQGEGDIEPTGQWRINLKGRQTSKRCWGDPSNPEEAVKILKEWQNEWSQDTLSWDRRYSSTVGGKKKKAFNVDACLDQGNLHFQKLADEFKKLQARLIEMEAARDRDQTKLDRAEALEELHRRTLDKTRTMSRKRFSTLQKKIYGDESILGQQVCHIISENNGGANHPDNFVMADGLINRHNSDLNDPYYVTWVGFERAKKAVEISRNLGTYNGPDAETLYKFGRAQAKATKDIVAPYYDMWWENSPESRPPRKRRKRKKSKKEPVSSSESEEDSLNEAGAESCWYPAKESETARSIAPLIDETRCQARVWRTGSGNDQCNYKRKGATVYCKTHGKQAAVTSKPCTRHAGTGVKMGLWLGNILDEIPYKSAVADADEPRGAHTHSLLIEWNSAEMKARVEQEVAAGTLKRPTNWKASKGWKNR